MWAPTRDAGSQLTENVLERGVYSTGPIARAACECEAARRETARRATRRQLMCGGRVQGRAAAESPGEPSHGQ